MINMVTLQCRIITAPWQDSDSNCWIRVSSKRDEPYTQVNGENRYYDDIVSVVIAKHREQYLHNNCYLGQMIMMTGCIRSINNNPVLLINDIYQITDKNGNFKK